MIPTYQDFVTACLKGDIATVNRALETEAFNPAALDNHALRMAAHHGHLSVINRLLEIEAVRQNAAAKDNSALIAAAAGGHLAMVNRLLELKEVWENAAMPNNYALYYATKGGHIDVAVRLLQIPSVSAYLRQHQQAFKGEHLAFFNEVFKKIKEEHYGRVWAVKELSPIFPWSIVNHIIGFAYHDDLCGNSDHLKPAPSDIADDGLITCPIINQFRRKAVGSIERVQANREAANSVSTNSTSEPVTKRPKAE